MYAMFLSQLKEEFEMYLANKIRDWIKGVKPISGSLYSSRNGGEEIVVIKVEDTFVHYIYNKGNGFSYYMITLSDLKDSYKWEGMITRHHRLFEMLEGRANG